jgi:hypothetical protein
VGLSDVRLPDVQAPSFYSRPSVRADQEADSFDQLWQPVSVDLSPFVPSLAVFATLSVHRAGPRLPSLLESGFGFDSAVRVENQYSCLCSSLVGSFPNWER